MSYAETVQQLSQCLQSAAAAALVNQLLAHSPELLLAAFISEPKERMDHSSAASSATSGLRKSRLCFARSSAATTAPLGMGCSHRPAPWMHPRGLLDPGHSLGATNSCRSGPDSSCGSLQRGQPSALQPPAPLLRSQAVQYPRLK